MCTRRRVTDWENERTSAMATGERGSTTGQTDDSRDGRLPPEALAYNPNAVLVISRDGVIRQAGGRCRELMDLDEGALVGRALADLVLPRDRTLMPDRLDALVGWEQRHRHPLELHLRYGPGSGDEARGGQMAGAAGADADRWRLFSFSAIDLADAGRGDGLLLALQPVGQPGSWDVSRSLLLEAVEAANSCIVIADLKQDDQPLVYANKGFRDLTGYGPDEILGRNCRFLQRRPDGSKDDDQAAVQAIHEALADGRHVNQTIRNYTKSGERFDNNLFLTPVRQDGELVAYIGVQNDVTNFVAAQDELARREEAIRSFFDASPMLMGIVELPERGRDTRSADEWARAVHVMINRRAAEFFEQDTGHRGKSDDAGDAQGRTLVDLTGDQAVAREIATAFAGAVAQGGPQTIQVELRRSGGEIRRLRVVANLVRPGDHEPPRCSYIADDVTDRTADADRRRLLEAAVENIEDGVLITTADLDLPGPHIVYTNDAFKRITGYAHEELAGQTPRILQGEQTNREVLDKLRRDLAETGRFEGETTNYRKGGEPYQVEWNIGPLHDADGRVTHWVSAHRDVTDRRRLERRVLDVQQREQQRIARDLHDTVAQQLNALTLYVTAIEQDLRDQGVDGEPMDMLAEARAQAKQAAEAARNISHSLMPVAAGERGLVQALRRLAARQQATYNVSHDVTHGGGDVTNTELATHVYRVAAEAMSNAVRHGKADRVAVRLAPAGDMAAELIVADDGVGVPPGALDGRGGGIGLDNMRYRANIIGGTLVVEPGDGPGDRPGTSVRLRFPLDKRAPAAES